MPAKEATARLKINKLLEESGWRFFDDAQGPANIILEPNTKISETQIDALGNDKFCGLFSPTDFDLVISDEARQSIGGNARAVFGYFVGYRLGLTATAKDYLKQSNSRTATRDPRETERRMMLDTDRIFGCAGSVPTFRCSTGCATAS